MNRKPKVYVSIPNTGWVRQEMAYHILRIIWNDKDHEVFVEPFFMSLDRDKYIFSTRNRIVRRFMELDYDFLLMIDADTVPLFNPLDLVDFSCDIIAAPERVIETPHITWSAWRVKDSLMAPIDIEKESDAVVEVDAVGAGCIAIKRSVLEKIKAPFNVVIDDEGILAMGADIRFCQLAKKHGFEVWMTTKLICEHYKEVPLYFARKWGAIL